MIVFRDSGKTLGMCLLLLGGCVGCNRSAAEVHLPSWFRSDAGPVGQQATTEQIQQQISVIEAKIKSHQQNRASVQSLLDDCSRQKSELVARMKQAGIKSGDDLRSQSRNRQLADQLLSLVQEIEAIQQDADKFDAAIAQAQGLHRRLQRALVLGEAGISEDELASMSTQLLRLAENDPKSPSGISDAARLEQVLQAEVYNK